jgi:hypothetical protein
MIYLQPSILLKPRSAPKGRTHAYAQLRSIIGQLWQISLLFLLHAGAEIHQFITIKLPAVALKVVQHSEATGKLGLRLRAGGGGFGKGLN